MAKSVIVGAGLVGPLAAMYLAKRGHDVTIYEWRPDIRKTPPAPGKSVHLVLSAPSVDPASSKTLESHRRVYRHDMAILEQLDLRHVPEGRYHLIALPLKIEGGDASPVRAILLEDLGALR